MSRCIVLCIIYDFLRASTWQVKKITISPNPDSSDAKRPHLQSNGTKSQKKIELGAVGSRVIRARRRESYPNSKGWVALSIN